MAVFDFLTQFISNTFIFTNLISFIILFAILWGLLEAINKFSFRINLVISIGFALIAVFTNPWILSYIATLGSYLAVVLFGILFLFGVIRWGFGRGRDIYHDTASIGKKRERLAKQRGKLMDKFEGAKNDSEKQNLQKQIIEIDNELKKLQLEEEAARSR